MCAHTDVCAFGANKYFTFYVINWRNLWSYKALLLGSSE